MTWTRLRRRALWIAGGLLLTIGGLFVFRWPIFGGLVRDEISRRAERELGATVEIDDLDGSLLTGFTATGVTLHPGPDSPLMSGSVRRVTIRYGFLGRGSPDLLVEGARIELAPSRETRPLHEDLRKGLKTLLSLRFEGRIEARDGIIVTHDGERIEILEARLQGTEWSARLRTEATGSAEASFASGVLEARAERGPLTRIRARLAPEIDLDARILDHDVRARGRLAFDGSGLPTVFDGRIDVTEGRADARIDFVAGRASLDLDGVLALRNDLRADVRVSGRAEGPISGALEDWTFSDVRAVAAPASVRGRPVDEIEWISRGGSLAEMPWRLRVRRGRDRVAAEGVATWRGGLILSAHVEASVENVSAYLPEVSASDARFEGRLDVRDRDVGVDGVLRAGSGSAFGESWSSAAVHARYENGAVVVRSAAVRGTRLAPEIRAVGRYRDGRVVALIETLQDRLEIDLRIDGGIEGRFRLGGARARASGRIAGGRAEVSVETEFLRADPVFHVRREGPVWTIDVEPGAVRVKDRTFEHGRCTLAIGPSSASLAGEEISAFAHWPDGIVRGFLEFRDARLSAKLGRDVEFALSWGATLRAEGRLGRDSLARVRVHFDRWNDFRLPDLRGAVAADLEITGDVAHPRVEGRVDVLDVAWRDFDPVRLSLPVRMEGDVITVPRATHPTPYGRLELGGRFFWRDRALDAEAVLDSVDWKRWVRADLPDADVRISARIRGSLSDPEFTLHATADTPGGVLPEPLGRLQGFRAELRHDRGWTLEGEGTLGYGPFRVLGRMEGDRLELRLTGTDLLVADYFDARVRVDPDLRITREGDGPWVVLGSIDVPIAIVYREFSAPRSAGTERSLSAPAIRLERSREGGWILEGLAVPKGVVVDVRVRTTGEMRVENSVVGALLEGDVRVRTAEDGWTLTGEARAMRGQVKLAAGVFVEIQDGRLELPEERDRVPIVRFQGRTERGNTKIGILLTGPLDGPTLILNSSPPRTQQEILAYLAFGRWPGTARGGDIVASLALGVVQEYVDAWPSPDPGQSLLDRFRLSVVEEESDPRRLPWELPSATTARGTVLRTEYVLSPYFSIVGESDRKGNVSGDLKVRFTFR